MSVWKFIELMVSIFTALPKRASMSMEDVSIGVDSLDAIEIENDPIKEPKRKYFYIIDCGHGPETDGKYSPDPGGGRFYEYKFNRWIGKTLVQELRHEKIKCGLSIEADFGHGDDLANRVSTANGLFSNLPKIFVSIHSNAAPTKDQANDWSEVTGIESWYYHGNAEGYDVASAFQNELVEELGWRDRGVRSRSEDQFYVLRKTNHTAVLLEIGFYNNLSQMLELRKEEIRLRIVSALKRAIIKLEGRNENI